MNPYIWVNLLDGWLLYIIFLDRNIIYRLTLPRNIRNNTITLVVDNHQSRMNSWAIDPPHPMLLINFDEFGFSRGRERGKTITVYAHKKCSTNPYWREETELHHIFLVASIKAGCTYIRLLCLSPRIRFDEDIINTFFNFLGTFTLLQKDIWEQIQCFLNNLVQFL